MPLARERELIAEFGRRMTGDRLVVGTSGNLSIRDGELLAVTPTGHVYDTLTPGSLTGGTDIAGTGTITGKGRVGPIGGIQQKIVAAADAGAKLFLVPPDNCDDALHADVKKDEIRLVKATTMHSDVESLKNYARDKSADLPSCG